MIIFLALDKRLIELNFAEWEFKKWEKTPKDEIQLWYDDWVNTPVKQGESYRELQSRALSFIKEIPNHYNRISNAGFIGTLWAYLNKKELKDSFNSLSVEYGTVLKIIYIL
ncbi:histidine phosphatase family protein [Tenacibaculum soleae]|uniref:histidine phosphatase family protein n=1 Tax=Tenacibaculum soleae TaxID=447689 RepID=UPI0026E238DB|nr:histidine phosphatase family protein [Tenacibaculum soleae]MDO6745461.1 histidine phosphatase family protein [Tenacibaculum soleae]